MAKAVERDFAWIRICATAVGVACLRHCRYLDSKVDSSPGSTRCLLPMSKAVRYNKRLLLLKSKAITHNDRLLKS